MGLYDRSEPLEEQALSIRQEQFGALSLEASESLVHLGILKINLSEPNEAIEILSRAIDIREPLLTEPDQVLIEAKAALGWTIREAGEHERAAALFSEALEAQRAIDPRDDEIANLMFGLASSYHDNGMLDEADSVFRAVLDEVDPNARPTPNVVSALRRVGQVRRLREQHAAADPILSSAVEMAIRLYGPEHGTVLVARQEYLANLGALGRWTEAEEMYRESIEISERILGPGHEVTARLQEGLGSTLEYMGEYDEAAEYQRLSLQEKVLRHENRDHSGVVSSLVAVARSLALAGRHQEARDYITQAEAMSGRLGNTPSIYSISSERSLGIIATADGDFESAEAHFLRALALAEDMLTRPSHRFITGGKHDYARMLVAAGRDAEAAELLRELEGLLIERVGEPHPLVDDVRAMLARTRAG